MQNELITYNYNTVNQLLNSTNPDKNFKYDADGNMTKGYTPEGYIFTAAYDAENRLQRLQYTDNSSVEHKREYIYREDSLLAQIKRYENNTLVDDTRIIRSSFLPIQERDANNNTVREYAWGSNMGGGIGGLLNLKQSGQNYACLYDGKGNVTSVLDNSQAMVASYRYDAFGKLMSKAGALNQPFMFSTKRYDEGTGLSYYGYRFYAPAVGRWLTRDPIGEAGGINLYGFVLNDPVNLVDPWGLLDESITNLPTNQVNDLINRLKKAKRDRQNDNRLYQDWLDNKRLPRKSRNRLQDQNRINNELIDRFNQHLNELEQELIDKQNRESSPCE